jgi:Tol biopolymer transport system component
MRKTSVALAGIVILSAGILAAWSVPQGEDPAVLLRAAIEKEEVDGDLEAAIEQYKEVIKVAGTNRAVAAQALLRLGGCYEKLGPEEARRTYQELIRDYGEQAKEVAAARQRLAALTTGAPARTGDSRLAIRRVPNLDMYARPSPDGKYLAFTEWKAGNLAVQDVATGAIRMLTKDGSFDGAAQWAGFSAWSRDSSRIAYQWDSAGPKEFREQLRIASVGGDSPLETIAIPAATWVIPLDWSPDGSRILCTYGQSAPGSGFALVGAGNGPIEKLDLPSGSWLEYRFSREGDSILYSASADGKAGPCDVFLRNLKTGVTTPIVQHPAEDLLVGVLPGTEWLFFASDRRGRLDLWAVLFRQGKTDGQPVLVKQGLGRFYPLGFTNDGRYYYATLSATDDVYLADFDPGTGRVTGEARKVTTRWDGVSGYPSYSPDGGSLAYLVKRGPHPIPVHTTDSLVVQSLKDPTAEPVVVGFEEFGVTQVGAPCWLADGTAVVLGGQRPVQEGSALYRVDLPSLRKTIVYSPAAGRRLMGHEPGRGGSYLYLSLGSVSAPTAGRADQVVRVDVAGGNERELFQAPKGQTISTIALSPDGAMLSIITRLDRYRRALLVIPSEGGTPRQIHEFQQPTGGGVPHVWAPGGQSILYVQRSDAWEKEEDRAFFLRSVRADGGPAEPQTIFRWRGQFFGLRFHPNGRVLAFTGRPDASTSSEVWVIENLREELKMLGGGNVR